MDGAPESVLKIQRAVEGLVEDIQRSYLVPRQKEAFLCCAKCCDNNASNTRDLQSCVERCSSGPVQQQKVLQQVMQDFQERFQRCAMRCQDVARESVSFEPSAAEQTRAQGKFNSCMDTCGTEFLEKIPKLKSDMVAALKRL